MQTPIHFNAPIWSTNICFSINIILFEWINFVSAQTSASYRLQRSPTSARSNAECLAAVLARARVRVEIEKRHLLSPRRKYLWAVDNIALRENTIVQFCPRVAVNSETPRFVTVRAGCIPKSVWWQCIWWICWGRRTNSAADLQLSVCFGRSCDARARTRERHLFMDNFS